MQAWILRVYARTKARTVNSKKVEAILNLIEAALVAFPRLDDLLWFEIEDAPDTTEKIMLYIDEPMDDTLPYSNSFSFKERWHVSSGETRHSYDEEAVAAKSSC